MPGADRDRARRTARPCLLLAGLLCAAVLAGRSPEGQTALARWWKPPAGEATAGHATGSAPGLYDAFLAIPQTFAAAAPTRFRSTHRLSAESQPYEDARKLLPGRFIDYETKRFVVLSDAGPGWTRRQTELLERTYHQYLRYTRRLGMRPEPLRHKLVCVLFEKHEDYKDFARAHDNVTADWISGYYSPKHDRVVFYNIEANPDVVLDTDADEDGDRHVVARFTAEDYAKAAIATTVHEAIHQLSFHTRLQSPHIQNPLWISEGLATSFETDAPGAAFGPDREYDLRRSQFESLLERGRLIPLRDLVTYTQMPNNDDDTIAAVYHESYALVTWMSRYRREQLAEYLQAMLDEPGGRPTPQRHLQIFESVFGDVDQLERTWERYERNSR